MRSWRDFCCAERSEVSLPSPSREKGFNPRLSVFTGQAALPRRVGGSNGFNFLNQNFFFISRATA